MLDRVTIKRARARSGDGPLVLALSGGGDSTALLSLLADEVGAGKLLACVVDHRLRSGSDVDARRAAGFAAALGVRAEILTLNWPGGIGRSQRAARRARYAALCEAARAAGANVVALAHTCDDQAETLMMRAAASSRWRGLAGMAALAPAPVWPEGRGIALLRPLLGVRRAALRDYLSARGVAWIEDPANVNIAFERVRARAHLARLERAGFDPMRLAALAARLREPCEVLNREAAALIASACRIEDGVIGVNAAAWKGDAEVRRRALSALIAAAAGAEREPPAAALGRLEERILERGVFRGATLGGARLRPNRLGFTVGRDPGAVLGRSDGAGALPPQCLPAERELVWDGRLSLVAPEPGWSVGVAASAAPALIAPSGQVLSLAQARGHVRMCWLHDERVRALLGAAG